MHRFRIKILSRIQQNLEFVDSPMQIFKNLIFSFLLHILSYSLHFKHV